MEPVVNVIHLVVVVVLTVWERAREGQVINTLLQCLCPVGREPELTPEFLVWEGVCPAVGIRLDCVVMGTMGEKSPYESLGTRGGLRTAGTCTLFPPL